MGGGQVEPDGGRLPVRAVMSSLAPGERALYLSTASLYPRNDPWKDFLADESVCPGGERTDLSPARNIATVACLVNFARTRHGVRALTVRELFNGVSAKKAKAIVLCGQFAHSPCGTDWAAIVRATGYKGMIGENLYVAGGRWGAPRVAVDAWLNSPPHRENLLHPTWRGQGLAVLPRQSFGAYRNVSLWVSLFGSR